MSSQFIDVLEKDYIPINLLDEVSIDQGESIFLNPLINPATIDSFHWSPTTDILNNGELIAEVRPNQTTTYTLEIFYGDCSELRTITVRVSENQDIYIANTFSPNDDGLNDYFFIQVKDNSEIEIVLLQIYDRWGNLIFDKQNPEPNDPMEGWNGTFNSQKVNPGVYSYWLKYSIDDNELNIAGAITIVR